MPIEAELPDGRILEFPDGTDPSVIQSTVKRILGVSDGGVGNGGIAGGDTVRGVVRDRATVDNIGLDDGFPEVPQSVGLNAAGPQAPIPGQEESGFTLANAGLEVMSAVNNEIIGLADAVGPEMFNQIAFKLGSDVRVPRIADTAFGQQTAAGFLPEGTTKDIARGVGAGIPAAIGGAGLLKKAASTLPQIAKGAEGIGAGLLRSVSAEGVGAAGGFGGLSGGGAVAGGEAGEAVGGETGRTIGEIAGAIAAPLSAVGIVGKARAAKNARKVIADEIRGGSLNVDNVTKSITDAGDIVTSKASKKALSNLSKTIGKDRAAQVVSVIENMTPASKQQVNKMLDIVDAVRKNPTLASRPSDILGQSVANRAKWVASINKSAGKEIGEAAKALSGKNVDIDKASQAFFDDLAEMGVKSVDDGGKLKLDFSESTFVGGGKGEIEKIANFVRSGSMDGKKAHELKQFIRDRVGFGQGTESAVSARSQGPLKKLSSSIDSVLDATSPAYKKANDNFAKTVELRNQFQKMAGKDVDLMSDLSASALGGKARRLVSNAESRINIQQQITAADKVLAEFGVKFKDDIPSLNHTVTQLEDIFKITPAASLKGNIERGGANVLQGASPTGEAVRGGLSKIQELRRPDFETQMKTLRALTRQKAR